MKALVAHDGSKFGDLALDAVAPWARAAGAEVVVVAIRQTGLVHETWRASNAMTAFAESRSGAIPGASPEIATPTAAEDRGQALERARLETVEALEEAAKTRLAGVPFEVHVEWADDVTGAIAALAEAKGVDLIVMGTHGRSGISGALLGSVAQSVLRRTSVPVMLVRAP